MTGSRILVAIVVALLGSVQAGYSCTNFIGMNIAEGEVGKHAHAQIWNPADSGVTLSVSSLCFAAMPISGPVVEHTGGDVTAQDTPYGAEGVNQGYCTNVSDTNPAKARMRSVRLPPGAGNGVTGVKPFAEIWTGKSGEDHCYQFKNPMIVPPGYGLTARGAGEASTVISTWQWSEIP